MRYSIRWLLALFAYVSLASAAIATRSNRLADVVWLVSLCAIGYAALLAFAGNGQQRFMALGFFVFAVAYIAGLFMLPHRVPAMHVFTFLGYDVEPSGYVSVPNSPVTGARRFFIATGYITPIVRTANAIGTLASGVVGCLLGALAYKHGSRE
jgi:hypothetical protein